MSTLMKLETDDGYWCYENGSRIAWDIDQGVAAPSLRVAVNEKPDWQYPEDETYYKIKTQVIYIGH